MKYNESNISSNKEQNMACENPFPVSNQIDTLTKEDYSKFMRKRKAMKGIEKWLI